MKYLFYLIFFIIVLFIPDFAFANIGTTVGAMAGLMLWILAPEAAAAWYVYMAAGAAFGTLTQEIAENMTPDMPGQAEDSATYDPPHPVITVGAGKPVSIGFGLCRIAGNVVRQNDFGADESYMDFIVCHGQGEWEEDLIHYINDKEFTSYSGAHNYWSHSGASNQTGVTNLFTTNIANYRNFAVTEYRLSKGSEITSVSNVNVVAKMTKCIEIGQSSGGTRSWTRNPAQILWHWYIDVEKYSASDLDENAFLALEEYCGASVSHEDPYASDITPFISSGRIKATSNAWSDVYNVLFAFDLKRRETGNSYYTSWLTEASGSVRLNVDFGRAVIITQIEIENFNSNPNTGYFWDEADPTLYGIQNFAVQGSNTSSDLSHVTYADGASGWTDIATGLTCAKDTDLGIRNPQLFDLDNDTAYRYYSIKVADNWGGNNLFGNGTDGIGVRRIKFRHCGNSISTLLGSDETDYRYTFDYNFDTKISINDAKKIIWQSFDGKCIMSQGKIKPVWDAAQEHDDAGSLQTKAVKHAFDTDTNVVSESFKWYRLERPNVVAINYLDSVYDFKKDMVIIRDDDDIDERGEVYYEENCWFIIDRAQAKRRCKRKFAKMRYRDYGCELTGFPDSQDLEIYDRVTVTDNEAGFSTKDFIIVEKDEDQYGRSVFKLEAYLSGVYDDAGFEEQNNYHPSSNNSNAPSPIVHSYDVTTTFNAVGASAYSAGSITVAFTPPDNPNYGYTKIFVSIDDSTYYYYGSDSDGTAYVNGMGTYYQPGDTVYVKLQNFTSNGIGSTFPSFYDDSVAIGGSIRIASFYFGSYDVWGGNSDIDNAATTIVLGGLDGTAKLALGPSANTLTLANVGTYKGFYADGDGNFRHGGPGAYGVFDATAGTYTFHGVTLSSDVEVEVAGTTADTWTINSDQDDVNVQLIFGRTTGGDATLQWNGTTVSLDKSLTLANGYGLNLQEDITFTGATTENQIKFPDALANALAFMEGSNIYQQFITTNGSEAVYFGKNVGIGMTSPDSIFHISRANSGNQMILERTGSNTAKIKVSVDANQIKFLDAANADADILYANSTRAYFPGNVGIGTVSPSMAFSIYDGTELTLSNGGGAFYIGNEGGANLVFDREGIQARENGAADDLLLNELGGNVGIGTVSPSALIHGIKTTEQLRIGYDVSNYASFTVGSGGNLTIAPTGDLIFNPTGNDILPTTNYDLNLGSISKKYLKLHAAELVVETLVAVDTQTSIAGRLILGKNSTKLTSDLGSGATTMYVEHNNLSNGDRCRLEASGKLEYISVDSAAGGAGPYSYTITRNLDGTGANDWYAGDCVLNTGTTGQGIIDIYAGTSILSDTGPTIVGWIRNSATYNDLTEGWAIGNLNGLYGYGVDTFGIGLGKYSAADYITIESTNGIRFFDSDDVVRGQLNSGEWTLGYTTNEHVKITNTAVQIKDGANVYTDLTAGVLKLGLESGGEYVQIDSTGIELYGSATKMVEITSAGIGYFGDQSNEHVKISTSGFQVYNGATLLATYAASTTLYDTGGADRLVLSTSGIFIGDQTEGEYINVDSTNGVRIYSNATLYSQITNAGILYLGDQSNEHVKISTSGLDIKDGATVLANYGSATTIGQVAASQNNILISSGAMYFRNNTDNVISITNAGIASITIAQGGDIVMEGGAAGDPSLIRFNDEVVSGEIRFEQAADSDVYHSIKMANTSYELSIAPYGFTGSPPPASLHFGEEDNEYKYIVHRANDSHYFYYQSDAHMVIGSTISCWCHVFPGVDSSYTLGIPEYCWSNIYGDAGVTSCSDEKWKTILGQETLGLDFVRRLPALEYKLNKNGKNRDGIYHGITGQDLEQALIESNYDPHIFAGLEYHDHDGETWMGINYGQLTSPIIKSIQTLADENDALKKRVAFLEQQLN